MASASTSGSTSRILVLLDDQAGNDAQLKSIFQSIFSHTRSFKKPDECFAFLETTAAGLGIISVLISGRYGEQYAASRLEPSVAVKYIYVYCLNTEKHKVWANKCKKVRLVSSDVNAIITQMKNDNSSSSASSTASPSSISTGASSPPDQPPDVDDDEGSTDNEMYRILAGNNYYDDIAVRVAVDDTSSGSLDDFRQFCNEKKESETKRLMAALEKQDAIETWLNPNLNCLMVHSNNFNEIWRVRWFLKNLLSRLEKEAISTTRNFKTAQKYCAVWLSDQEFEAMKDRISESIIFSEFLIAYAKENDAVQAWAHKPSSDQQKHKVMLEITIDTSIKNIAPCSSLTHSKTLIWFGSRQRLLKIEFNDKDQKKDSYWTFGFKLIETLEKNNAMSSLHKHYLEKFNNVDNKYQVFGQLLMIKGMYSQAYEWFKKNGDELQLAEVEFHRGKFSEAENHMKKITEKSSQVDLIRAIILSASSNDKMPEARSLFQKTINESESPVTRAKAMLGLGFHHLIMSNNAEALVNFESATNFFKKNLTDNHPEFLKALICLGFCHLQGKRIKDAEDCFRNALAKQDDILTYLHPDFVRSRTGLAYCAALNQPGRKKAIEELSTCLEILREAHPYSKGKHPLIIATKNDIKTLQNNGNLNISNCILNYL